MLLELPKTVQVNCPDDLPDHKLILSRSGTCGIYYLCDNTKVYYIGQSIHIEKRIIAHSYVRKSAIAQDYMEGHGAIYNDVKWSQVLVQPIKKDLLDFCETIEIARWQPSLNSVPGPAWKTISEFISITHILPIISEIEKYDYCFHILSRLRPGAIKYTDNQIEVRFPVNINRSDLCKLIKCLVLFLPDAVDVELIYPADWQELIGRGCKWTEYCS